MTLRLRVLTQLFYPEMISTGQTMTELGEALQAEGVDVSVYCGYPTLGDRQAVPKRLVYEGIVVQRLWGTQFPKLNFWGKLMNHLTFSAAVIVRLLLDREKMPVLVVTNPPILPILCAFVCVLKRRPYLYLVFDVYPETAIKAGVLSATGGLSRVWKRLQGFALRHAERVIVIGRCMSEIIIPYMRWDLSRLVHIPVWVDDKRIHRDGAQTTFPWSNQGKIVVGYSGNMARFHDIETIVAAAEILQEDPRFLFVFVGDGYKRNHVAQAAKRLSNMRLESYVPREQLGDLLASFSVGVVSLLPGHEGLSVPSKTYGLLAAGCPVLGVLPAASEIALMIQESEVGRVVSPGDVAGFVAALRDCADRPSVWANWGENARLVSETRYSLRQVAIAYKSLLVDLENRKGTLIDG
jgi:glycosyltransferase involved in cell wall biosynthesis